MAWPKTFFKSKYILLGTLKKNFSSNRPWQPPSTSADISKIRKLQDFPLALKMLAEVLGCCQGLIELNFFLRVPNNIYFDLKKVLGQDIALYTSPKSGEITFNLSRFWDTCWLIKRAQRNCEVQIERYEVRVAVCRYEVKTLDRWRLKA